MQGNGIFQKKITANPDVVFTDLEDGSAVLLDIKSKFYYSLNETGCFMWQVFDGQSATPVQRLLEKVTREYEVSEEEARRDIEEFIFDLTKEGLVELS